MSDERGECIQSLSVFPHRRRPRSNGYREGRVSTHRSQRTPSRDLLERLARASGKHLGESSSVSRGSVGYICKTDIVEVERAFREDGHGHTVGATPTADLVKSTNIVALH